MSKFFERVSEGSTEKVIVGLVMSAAGRVGIGVSDVGVEIKLVRTGDDSVAAKSVPIAAGMSMDTSADGERFGHARAARVQRLLSIRAMQTANWRPAAKPLVPSIGSMVY